MRGRKHLKRKEVAADKKYQSISISKFINKIMLRGQKKTAESIVYQALDIVSEKTKKGQLEAFEQIMTNVRPLLEVRSRRIGGATYQVPMEVTLNRGQTLAMRWIINAARSRQGKPMNELLAEEMVSAYNKSGSAMTKRENTHKMAEANRAFAHYAKF